MGTRTRQGSPRPYELKPAKTADGSLTQYAIVKCCDCTESAAIPWIHPENPTRIITRFQRHGWTIYQNKARCPEHSIKRKQQQAIFARRNEQETTMPMPELRKTVEPITPETHVEPIVLATYILTVYHSGEVKISPIENAQDMLLGDKTYMVIPR